MAALRRQFVVSFLGAGLAEMIIGAVRFGAILGLGAAFVRSGATSVGTVMAFFAFSGRLVAPIAAITRFLASLRKGAVSLSRLREIRSRLGAGDSGRQPERVESAAAAAVVAGAAGPGVPGPGSVGPGAADAGAVLAAQGVTFAYPDTASPALLDVSVSLPQGRKIAVVGENGSGKTTLGLILGGLLRADAGSVFLASEMPRTDRINPVDEILYVPGEAFLFPGAVRDNLRVGAAAALSDETLADALRVVSADFALSSEAGLDLQVAEDGGNLSAGQRQKLSLARALARRPSFLILDEATSSFDAPSESALHDWLQDQNVGVCLITHNVKNVLWVDEVSSSPRAGSSNRGHRKRWRSGRGRSSGGC